MQNHDKGYNIDPGGRPQGAVYISSEGRRKISEAHKKLWKDPSYRARMLEQRKKHPPTKECRQKGVVIAASRKRGKIALNAKPVI